MVSLVLFRPMKVRETIIRARNDEAILIFLLCSQSEKES
jgi:hypothetical protein